jgi:uncharacterized protein
MSSHAPTSERERIVALDALRGFALFGVLLVNLPFMALSTSGAFRTPGTATDSMGNVLAWALERTFFETKFFTIFSLLFGMGLILQMQRAESSGRPFKGLYLRRLGWLGLLGLLHGTLLFMGDILLPYACVGLLLFLCRGMRPRNLVIVGLIPLAIGFFLSAGWSYSGLLEGVAEGGTGNETEWVAATEGPLSKTLSTRAISYAGWLAFSSVISFNWRIVAMFFLGAAAMKTRLLARSRSALHKRVALIGLVVGSLLEVGAVAGQLLATEPSGLAGFMGLANGMAVEVGSLFLSAGYVATVSLLAHSGALPRLVHGLASVGRMALTNYLAQSILGNLIFMWFGLGLFGRVDRLGLLAITVGIFALQMLFSVVWLRTCRSGPCEWVWRRLTYGRVALR